MRKLKRVLLFSFLFTTMALLLAFCSLRRYANKSYEEAKLEAPFDVIVVPGVPYDKANTTRLMLMRILWAKHLYDSGFTHNVIFSGSSVYTPFVEGIAMKLIADTLGMPHDHTFSEVKAEHSTENAYYGYKMAQRMGFKKIALATDPFQSATLEGLIRKYCPGMKTIPMVYGKVDRSKTLPAIDTTKAYVANFVSIRKTQSWWNRWRRTMGKRVKEEASDIPQ